MKRVFLFLLSCAVILPCTVTTGLGQQDLNSGAQAGPLALTGGLNGNGHFAVDYSFKGSNGATPTATPIQDGAGNLYGTTSSGGSGLGVVFRLDTTNHEKVLYAFSGPDGATPFGALVMDGSGNLYGTTFAGGAANLGTVFKIDSAGNESVLHSFAGSPNDGANPYAGLVMDKSGNLYGTTVNGGSSNSGTIFKIDTAGNESVLYSFLGSPNDGANPMAALTLDPNGNLYGTTLTGGTASFGTVFELDTTNTETVLYNFTGLADGANPFGGVTRDDGTGILYGTAENGGRKVNGPYPGPWLDKPYGCCKGVLYALNGGGLQVLYTFTGGNDGGSPAATLVLSNGILYGTTLIGGPGHRGTAFSVTIATGSETVLHGFTGKSDGGTPGAGLLLNNAGVLYGTAVTGGRNGYGTVFQYKK